MTRATSAVFLFFFLAAGIAKGQVLCRSEADDVAALQSFNRAVNDYVELRARLDDPLSPERICSNPEAIAAATATLAEAIRFERSAAEQGDIFTPEVADLFRMRLSTIHTQPPGFWPALPEDEPEAYLPVPVVNTRLAWGASVPVEESIARVLPPLPSPLEYRLSGSALVLVDASTDLVIDVLDDLWPTPNS